MRIKLSKKKKIIVIAIICLVLGGTGGYLLWRVNQDKTVAPTDSEASGGAGACCNSAGCVAGWECKTNIPCSSCEGAWTVGRAGPTCGTIGGVEAKCRFGFHCTSISENTCCPDSPLGTCVKVDDPEEPIGGTCDEETKRCEWPGTIISSTCACEECNGTNGCSGNPPTCTPGACGSDEESCGVSGNHDGGSDCVKKTAIKCVVYHADCNNPSNIYRYCRPKTTPPPTNVCDSGSWTTQPTGTYAHCASIKYFAKAKDSNGIDESSISVKLNDVARTNFSKLTSGTTTAIYETLSSTTNCLAPGTYTLKMSWKDKLGAGGTNCALSTTFKVLPEPNVCDSGAWTTKPTGTYAHCTSIKYIAKATDSNGIDESSVSVKLNNVTRTNVSKVTSGTTTTISETLSSTTNCLAPGSYTLNMSWKDKLGAGGTNCALSTTFKVLAEPNTNVCDPGSWVTKPTGTYAQCASIKYVAKAVDSDGIDQSSIWVKLNDVARTNVSKVTSGTTTTISETLSSATNCLAAGSYTLTMGWKDKLGATGTDCALDTVFTVLPGVKNPDWNIAKGVVEQCIGENTSNPTSQLTYAITIKNTGAGEGTITKIIDVLDPKVLQTYISGISNSGVYDSGSITWTLSAIDKIFAPGQEKVFTYVVTVPKDTFGSYANTVTAYPSTGENLVAIADVTADCVIEAPDTGLFDSTWSKVILGVIFIAIGINYSHISKLYLGISNFARKLHISLNDNSAERRKKNFEKRVVKR